MELDSTLVQTWGFGIHNNKYKAIFYAGIPCSSHGIDAYLALRVKSRDTDNRWRCWLT